VTAVDPVFDKEDRLARSPVLWTMVAIMAAGVWMLIRENGPWVADVGADALIPLVGWTLYGCVALAIVARMQRFGRRPRLFMWLALLWGGLGAGAFSQRANIALETLLAEVFDTDVHAWVSTPVVEEVLKMIGVLAIVLIARSRVRGALDGLFYGVWVGVGFLVVESFVYTVAAIYNSGSTPLSATFGYILLRGVMGGVLTHPVFTAVSGAAIAYFFVRIDVGIVRRCVVLVMAILLSIGAHAVYNQADSFGLQSIAAGLVPLAVLVVLLRRLRGVEERRLGGLVKAGFGVEVLTADEVSSLTSGAATNVSEADRLAALRYIRALDVRGPDSSVTASALQRLVAERAAT
jgi:RsiW-degrading membrane proteinase PrsW (M82 family)